MELTKNMIEWLANGERGTSSETIFQTLTGMQCTDDPSFPWDADDLRRCRLLLEKCPELAPRIGEMRTVSPIWNALATHWSELCAMMDDECPKWRDKWGYAGKTCKRMADLIEAATSSPSPARVEVGK
jgi:hypothetical protein